MKKISVLFPCKTVLFGLFSIVFLVSCQSSTCSKTVSCPAYSSPLADSWFPYHDQQQLVFKSNGGVYDTLHLQLTDSTPAYTHTSGGFAPVTGCSATKSLSSIERDLSGRNKFAIDLSLSQPPYSTTTGISVDFSVGDSSFFGATGLSDSGFNFFNISGYNYYANGKTPQNLYNYQAGGITYPFAQAFLNDTAVANNTACTYRIVITKNVGIIEYETNPGNITWIKQ